MKNVYSAPAKPTHPISPFAADDRLIFVLKCEQAFEALYAQRSALTNRDDAPIEIASNGRSATITVHILQRPGRNVRTLLFNATLETIPRPVTDSNTYLVQDYPSVFCATHRVFPLRSQITVGSSQPAGAPSA